MRIPAVLELLAPRRCAGCDRGGSALCERCVDAISAAPPPLIGGAKAAFAYRCEVRRVLHHGKFRDCRSALYALAWMGAARLDAPAGAVVTAVPLWPRRLVERGYNQAAVVGSAFAGFHRLSMATLLMRIRDTTAQSMLSAAARRTNVDGAFAGSVAAEGATVWLVDDVLTTGATVAAARRALLEAGAVRVDVAVLAAVL